MANKAPKLVYLATSPLTAFRLMEGQLADMQARGFEVVVIASPGPQLERVAQREGVEVHGVPMTREISPVRDAVALVRLIALFRRLRPDLVSAGTPKAGLLGVIAARATGVPVVVYLLRGLRLESARGARRVLLTLTEHVSGALADRIFCNSRSLQEKFIALGCAPRSKTFVPGHGTSNGVDTARFERAVAERNSPAIADTRQRIPSTSVVVGFVGRLTRDKGVGELCEAFRKVLERWPTAHLLLVGAEDLSDPLPSGVKEWLATAQNVQVTGFVDDPAPFYALIDVLAFPSHREGFPNVPLEAAAAGIPCVAFAATGTVDAIVHGETGVVVPLGDVVAFSAALERYVADKELRLAHGARAQERVKRLFGQRVVWDALAEEYQRLLRSTA